MSSREARQNGSELQQEWGGEVVSLVRYDRDVRPRPDLEECRVFSTRGGDTLEVRYGVGCISIRLARGR